MLTAGAKGGPDTNMGYASKILMAIIELEQEGRRRASMRRETTFYTSQARDETQQWLELVEACHTIETAVPRLQIALVGQLQPSSTFGKTRQLIKWTWVGGGMEGLGLVCLLEQMAVLGVSGAIDHIVGIPRP